MFKVLYKKKNSEVQWVRRTELKITSLSSDYIVLDWITKSPLNLLKHGFYSNEKLNGYSLS